MSKKRPRGQRLKSRSGKPQSKKTWVVRAFSMAIAGIKKKWFRRIAALISGVTVLITLASIPSLLPRVSVSPGVARDPLNPLDTIFWLSNDGLLKIKNIEYKFDILHYDVDGGGKINLHGNRNISFTDSRVEATPELTPAEKTSLLCRSPLKIPDMVVKQCEIEIVVFFKWFGRRFERRFRYEAVRDQNNQWQWTNRASSEKY